MEKYGYYPFLSGALSLLIILKLHYRIMIPTKTRL